MNRTVVYDYLRKAIDAYSEELRSTDMEIFAYEMEVQDPSGLSRDPALLDVFERIVPETVSLPEAFRLSAEFVDRELISLRRVGAATKLRDDLLLISDFQNTVPD